MLRRIFLLFILLSAFVSNAQVDSDSLAQTEENATMDTTQKKKGWSRPKKATLLSMAVPGLGQVYNGRTYWWKLPILYGGFALIYVFYEKNQTPYSFLNSKYDWYEVNSHIAVSLQYNGFNYSSLSQLKAERDTYRRYRDMSIFFGLSLYALNVVDACVEAHLLDFDISDDLSMRLHPVFLSQNNVSFAPGVGLQLNFKNPRLKKLQFTNSNLQIVERGL